MELKEKVMNKINGLLAKTTENGCTPEEAAAAGAMVQKLLAKYHLELGECKETPEEVCGCVEEIKKNWQHSLAHVIAENSCCQVIATKTGTKTKLSFLGRETDLEATLALYDSFLEACENGIRQEKQRCKIEKGTTAGAENSYAAGFISAVKEEMGKQCRALMLVTPEDVKNKLHELFPYIKKKCSSTSINRDSYENGRQAGRYAAGRREIAG